MLLKKTRNSSKSSCESMLASAASISSSSAWRSSSGRAIAPIAFNSHASWLLFKVGLDAAGELVFSSLLSRNLLKRILAATIYYVSHSTFRPQIRPKQPRNIPLINLSAWFTMSMSASVSLRGAASGATKSSALSASSTLSAIAQIDVTGKMHLKHTRVDTNGANVEKSWQA